MIEQPYTHIGVVVPDLDASMKEVGTALGLTWAEVISWELDLWTPDGVVRTRSTFTYAAGAGPSIELLQEQPGPVWTAGPAHHVGYWSTDMVGDGERLGAQGYTLVATLAGDRPSGFAYYAGPSGGPLLELVDAALRPRFLRWWAGGRF